MPGAAGIDRALKRQFSLDDAYLEDLKLEIIEIHQVAVDQDGTMPYGREAARQLLYQPLHPQPPGT